jgi:hypothetical protein
MDPNLAQRLAQLEAQLQSVKSEIDAIRAASEPTASAKPTAHEHNRKMGLSLNNVTALGVRCPVCARDGRSVDMTTPPGNRSETIDLGNYLLLDAFCASCGTQLKLWRKIG